jgi:hypothetical protein
MPVTLRLGHRATGPNRAPSGAVINAWSTGDAFKRSVFGISLLRSALELSGPSGRRPQKKGLEESRCQGLLSASRAQDRGG